jgi:hypothetical protein
MARDLKRDVLKQLKSVFYCFKQLFVFISYLFAALYQNLRIPKVISEDTWFESDEN